MKNEDLKTAGRILLGVGLIFAGVSHLTFARKEFQAQVPDFVPLKKDDTVVISGIAEIALGTVLVTVSGKRKENVGQVAAAFFTAVFPGNIAQYVNQRDAFGLNTDRKRLLRLFFQPALVWWALKSTSKK